MSERRVTVWVQRFKDRRHLMLQWIDPGTGKRKSKSAETDDEKKVEQARADLEADLNHGRHQEASRMSWERFRELFEAEHMAGTRKSSRERMRTALDLFEGICRPGQLRAINERTLAAFVAGLRQRRGRGGNEHMAPYTIKVTLAFLRIALKYAVRQGLLPRCPNFPAIKAPLKLPQPVPAESFEKLLDKAPDQQMRVYLLTGWLAGLRLTEAFCLEWEETDEAPWVDLARDRIVLPGGFTKAVKDQWLPLDAVLREALLALPRHGKRVFRFLGMGGRPVSENTVSHWVSALGKKDGVRLTMKTLRKGFGSHYAGKVPAQVLQKLMRHADIKTTMAFYANVDDAVEEAVKDRHRNSSRNTAQDGGRPGGGDIDATPVEQVDKGDGSPSLAG